MMIMWLVCGLIGGGCIGFLFACFIAGSGSGDEYVRELRKEIVNDVQDCCDQYKDQFPGSTVLIDHIREDVCHIIRSEQM